MKQKDILFIFISSFVVVVAWVGFNLYHAWATTTISADLQIQLDPIDPNFDMEIWEKIKTRRHIEPMYEASEATQISPTQAPPPQPIPTKTQEIIVEGV